MTRDPNPPMMFCAPVAPWHDWFAWFPIRTYDQQLVWLKKVRRRSMQVHFFLSPGGGDRFWQYHNQSQRRTEQCPSS